jgi:hypothetical protein
MNGKLESTWDSTINLFDQNGNWQVGKIETFYHTQHGSDMTEKILTKRKIEYY